MATAENPVMASLLLLLLLLFPLVVPCVMCGESPEDTNGWIPVKEENLGSSYWEKLPANSKGSIRKFRERSLRTMGGAPVALAELPFALWVVATRGGGGDSEPDGGPLLADCSGVLVAASWFLTSSLCLTGSSPHAVVYAGLTNSSEASLPSAQKRFLHSVLRSSSEELLILANTTKSFFLSSFVWPAVLPEEADPHTIWRPVRCVVSGLSKTGEESSPLRLRVSSVHVRSLCTHWSPRSRLCSLDLEDGRPSASAADSGAALLCPHVTTELRLRGVVLGYRRATLDPHDDDDDDVIAVTEYADVAYHARWLRDVLGRHARLQADAEEEERGLETLVTVAVGVVLVATVALYCGAFVTRFGALYVILSL